MMALLGDHQDVVRALLHARADVNARRSGGVTALMLASFMGYQEVVRELLAARADVNANASMASGNTMFIGASRNGQSELVRINNGDTALMLASWNGHQEVVRALLAAKADVNAMGADGHTALIAASLNGHQEVVRALLAARADVNARMSNGHTALTLASENGHQDVVRVLLAARANVNARKDDGATALESAGVEMLRVEGSVQAAKLIKQTQPVYPALAKQARIQGKVQFTATINKEGKVQDLKLIDGHPLLVAAARAAVLQWEYEPTLSKGSPVSVMTTVDVDFSLP